MRVIEGTAAVGGNVLTVTPKAGFHGDMTGVYGVMDATNDPNRVVQGRVVVKVLGRPDPPQKVTATATGPGSAFVNFQAAAPNGGTISGYTIIDSVSGKPYNTTNPGMEVTGLQNGV